MLSVNFFSPFASGIFAVFAVLFGVFFKEKIARISSIIICLLGVVASFAPIYLINRTVTEDTSAIILIVGISYQIFLSLIAVASMIIIASDSRSNINRFESYPLILLSFSGMLFAVFSESILGMYLGIELFSISGYILAGLNREKPTSNEAIVKYFVMGAASSALMIYGISLIYGFTGGSLSVSTLDVITLNFNKLPLTIGFLLFAFGIFFKT